MKPRRLARTPAETVVRLQDIEIWGYHGCEPAEAAKGGPFLLSLVAVCRTPPRAEDDSLEHRPDYAAMADLAVAAFREKRRALLEPVAERIAARILRRFPLVREITVSVKKLRPMMPHRLAFAEVAVTRTRP